MSSYFTRLEELSTQLNASSDALSESIKRLEAKLASLRLGISVWLEEPIDTYLYQDDRISTFLGYTRVNGKWCLALRDDSNEIIGDPELEAPVQPLLQASRENRIKALQLMPAMIVSLETAAEAELKTVQLAMDLVAVFSG
jgi:hypothetical protein